MSKTAKLCITFLFILVICAVGLAAYTVLEKGKVDQVRVALQKQIDEFQGREKKYILDNQDLQKKLEEVEAKKNELEKKLASFDVDVGGLDSKVKELTAERDEWKKRVDALREERDQLLVKVQQNQAVVTDGNVVSQATEDTGKVRELETALSQKEAQLKEALDRIEQLKQEKVLQANNVSGDAGTEEGDSYWAGVLKQKAALELELENLKQNVSEGSIEVVELKKQNSDLQLEINRLMNEKTGIEREIKHGNDLSDNLSLELARAQNDKKFLNERFVAMNGENVNLHEQIKQLTSTKIALEKSIVRIQDEKKDIEKRLLQTENVIQSRIDEIWQIKESLDKEFKPTAAQEGSNEIELSPIIVSPQQQGMVGDESSSSSGYEGDIAASAAGIDGSIVSVNEENNFVIVNIGANSGIKLGDLLNVYRGTEYIGGLEVIQVRNDIAAADIKNKVVKIQVGDAVK